MSKQKQQFVYTTCSAGILSLQFSWTVNNLLSYCGLVDAKIWASDKDLPVPRHKVKNFKFLTENPYILAVYLIMYHKELWGKSSCGNNLFYSWQLIFSIALPNCNFSRKPLLTRLILSFNLLHMLDFQRKYLFYNLFWIFLLEIGKLCFICYDLCVVRILILSCCCFFFICLFNLQLFEFNRSVSKS